MKASDKNKELSYLRYWDVNNLCGRAMLQKLPVNNFEWIKDTSQFNNDFIKSYNEESNKGYFLEVDVQFLDKFHNFHNNFNDLPFLPERVNIEKVERLIPNLHDKTENIIHMKNLKQSLKNGLVLK